MGRFCSLFSSSSGNCTYIGAGTTGILIDAGVSTKRIENALIERGIDPRGIQAIFVTHSHSDHIQGIRVFGNRYKIPVYATATTAKAIEDVNASPLSGMDVLPKKGPVKVGDLKVEWFPTPHDAPGSVGYVVETPDSRRAAVATDMGFLENNVQQILKTCDLVLIESNHDIEMLKNGPYPYPLKTRILGSGGHLSNEACADFLPFLAKAGVTHFILGHLSAENNRPKLAEQTAVDALTHAGFVRGEDYRLSVAKPVSTDAIIYF